MKTAVEWLFYNILLTPLDIREINKCFEQAKEMEEEQIKNAFVECWKANVPDGIECKLDAEQYYNETYNNTKASD